MIDQPIQELISKLIGGQTDDLQTDRPAEPKTTYRGERFFDDGLNLFRFRGSQDSTTKRQFPGNFGIANQLAQTSVFRGKPSSVEIDSPQLAISIEMKNRILIDKYAHGEIVSPSNDPLPRVGTGEPTSLRQIHTLGQKVFTIGLTSGHLGTSALRLLVRGLRPGLGIRTIVPIGFLRVLWVFVLLSLSGSHDLISQAMDRLDERGSVNGSEHEIVLFESFVDVRYFERKAAHKTDCRPTVPPAAIAMPRTCHNSHTAVPVVLISLS